MTCTRCASPATTTLDGFALCADHAATYQAYLDKRQARLDRLRHAADKARADAAAMSRKASDMASIIPFGQPIHIGHYSEGRDRRYRERIERTFRRAFETFDEANALEQKAQRSEDNDAIRSDDPLAVQKLEAKIATLKAEQERAKDANKRLRKIAPKTAEEAMAILTDMGLASIWVALMSTEGAFDVRRWMIPAYELSNRNANIRRLEARLKTLKAVKAKANAMPQGQQTETHGDVTLVRDYEGNRLRLVFPGKPSAGTIALLKSKGFVWSNANKAWQRQLNNASEAAAEYVLTQVKES